MNRSDFQIILGNVVSDSDFRSQFFDDVETIIGRSELSSLQAETLRGMANCPSTRFGTLLTNKSHKRYEGEARKKMLVAG